MQYELAAVATELFYHAKARWGENCKRQPFVVRKGDILVSVPVTSVHTDDNLSFYLYPSTSLSCIYVTMHCPQYDMSKGAFDDFCGAVLVAKVESDLDDIELFYVKNSVVSDVYLTITCEIDPSDIPYTMRSCFHAIQNLSGVYENFKMAYSWEREDDE